MVGGDWPAKKIAFISTPSIQLNLKSIKKLLSLSCCCFPPPRHNFLARVCVSVCTPFLSRRRQRRNADNSVVVVVLLCVFYLIHRPTSQHTHTLAPAAFPLFLTHTHTQNQKKMISGFCANCVTHTKVTRDPQ
jgi:hypothetical protein